VRWRAAGNSPPAAVSIGAPDDADAHDARTGTASRAGQKRHITGARDDAAPRRIAHVETTSAPVVDAAALPPVHHALRGRDLPPAVQVAGSGDLDAPQIVAAREDHAIARRGAARPDDQWQARAQNGFALDDFRLDRGREQATRPTGHTGIGRRRRPDPPGRALLRVTSSSEDGAPCPRRPACRRAQGHAPRRTRCLRPRAHLEAPRPARLRGSTAALGETSARRAGSAGTLARGIRRCRLRRTRYRGQPKVRLGHILAATGCHFPRLGAWPLGIPRRKPPRSPFARLLAEPSAA